MERVAFLPEATGSPIACLLNPESVVMRRAAGVRPRPIAIGLPTGTEPIDDPLLYVGGGRTELDLDLFFDVSLEGTPIVTDDVRDLTRPLWQLTESAADRDGRAEPPVVRFLWGKAWNLPGIVVAVAERLEQFTPSGAPRRSWLRMRLLRTAEPTYIPISDRAQIGQYRPMEPPDSSGLSDDAVRIHEVRGNGSSDGIGEPLTDIAARYYGEPRYWRILATSNGIADPLHIPVGSRIRIPPRTAEGRAS